MGHAVCCDHFTRAGERAKARGNVECRSAKAAVDLDCFARVDADADVEGGGGIGAGLLLETHLELDGGAKRLSCGSEHGQRLVSPPPDDPPTPRPNPLPR